MNEATGILSRFTLELGRIGLLAGESVRSLFTMRPRVREVLAQKEFDRAVNKVYRHNAEEGLGINFGAMLRAAKDFLHKGAPAVPGLKAVFPAPDSKEACDTLMFLLLEYVLEGRERKAIAGGYGAGQPVALRDFRATLVKVFECAAIVKEVVVVGGGAGDGAAL